jgi:hypothetical protein
MMHEILHRNGKIYGTTPMFSASTPPLTTRLREQERAMPIVRIPLTQGKFAIIDAEDEPLVSQYRWYAQKSVSGTWYAQRTCRDEKGKKCMMSMHRFIMDAPKGMYVDHINHDGIDNRRENLRICTNRENIRNRSGVAKHNHSGFLGVSKKTGRNRWYAYVTIDRKRIRLGNFATPEEAARARDEGAKRYFGEFAPLNFPDEREVSDG